MNPNNPFDRLEKLVLKRKVLIRRKERLERVCLDAIGAYKTELRLEDGNGNYFAITHPKFLQRFYSDLHTGYVKKIQAIEKQIMEHKHNNY